MATMQQCVTKMKEQDMTLNPETCKFVRNPKTKSKSRRSKKNIQPILKKGKKLQLFEEKLPTGLDAELSEMIEPKVKINSKVRENTQNFNNTNTWSPEPIPEPDLKKLTKAYLKKQQEQKEKEENIKLATALLPPTNNPSVFGKKTLQQVYDEGRDSRYNPSEWTKTYNFTPAEVRSSINLTRAKRAKKNEQPYNLQPFNENALVQRMEEKEAREKIKRDLENKARENKARETRKLQVRKRANAKLTKVNVAQPRRRKQEQEPVAKNTRLLEKVKARKAEVERLAEIEKIAKNAELKAKGNRAQAEADLIAQELGYNSNSSNDSWQAYQKREGEKHMAR